MEPLIAQAPTILDASLAVGWPVLLVVGGIIALGAEARIRIHQHGLEMDKLDQRLSAMERQQQATAVQIAGMSAMFGEIRASLAEVREDLRAIRDRAEQVGACLHVQGVLDTLLPVCPGRKRERDEKLRPVRRRRRDHRSRRAHRAVDAGVPGT